MKRNMADLFHIEENNTWLMTLCDMTTLLLTFFYRQMRELIARGHIHIAQPPLYRVKRGRGETYVKDDRELEAWLFRRAAETRVLRLPTGDLTGSALEALLHRLVAFQRYRAIVDRRGAASDIVQRLLDNDAHSKEFFTDPERLEQLAQEMRTSLRSVRIAVDQEHNAYQFVVEDRSGGFARRQEVGIEFVETAEYRALLTSYRATNGLTGPMIVATVPKGDAETPAEGAADVPDTKTSEVEIRDIDALVEYFLAAGRRGVAINRYKGLGEMNPDQLWETTMDPNNRTLLQVHAEDDTEADLMFTTLMGDQVEPRRKFIEDNALDVRNLDV